MLLVHAEVLMPLEGASANETPAATPIASTIAMPKKTASARNWPEEQLRAVGLADEQVLQRTLAVLAGDRGGEQAQRDDPIRFDAVVTPCTSPLGRENCEIVAWNRSPVPGGKDFWAVSTSLPLSIRPSWSRPDSRRSWPKPRARAPLGALEGVTAGVAVLSCGM